MRLPLVARAGAISEVGAVLAAAREGHGGLVLVTGEAGLGKTRLAEETARIAAGFRIVWVWCAPGPALQPWSRIVRTLADGPGGALVDRLPDLASLAGAAAPPDIRDAGAARWRLSLDLADLMRASGPVLVIVDDLQDADESSLRLLAELAPALRSAQAVVLATARDGEHDWRGREQTWGVLNRLAEHIRPQALATEEVAELLASAGLTLPRPAIDTITERTKGNPLLLCELAAAPDPATAVPTSLRAMIAAQLVALPETERALVSAAAVLGGRFRLDVLAELAGCSLTRVGATIADGAGLVERAEPGHGRFRHALIRDAVQEALPSDERAALHRRAAGVLRALADRGREADAAEIAGHLLQAGPDALGEAAAQACAAGAEALRRLASEDAVQWYRQAGDCLAAARGSIVDKARCGIGLGVALNAAGRRAEARACLLDAAGQGERAQRPDLVAEAVLELGTGPAGFEVGLLDQRQIDLLEQVRGAALPEATRALVTARLSVALTLIGSDERRLVLAREAVELARGSGDEGALASALAALCDAMAGPDHCLARLSAASEIVGIAERRRDPLLVLLGRRLRLVALLETGELAAADQEITTYRSVAGAVRHPLYQWYVPLWRGMRALSEKRFGDCRAALAEAADIGERAGSDNAALLVSTQRWLLAAESGDRDGLAAMFAEFDRLDLPGVWPRITRGLLLAQLGRLPEARAQLDSVASLLPGLPRDSEWLPAMAQLAETIALTGPHPLAGQVRRALTPYADLFVVEGIGAALRGPVRGFLDRLDAPSGEPDEFRRDGAYWTIRHAAVCTRLPDSKGLRDLGVLLAHPGRSFAALDLAGAVIENDTGDLLDPAARTAYQGRLRELETEADEADAAGDVERASRIGAERETLIAALTSAYGLGGRARHTGSSAERARTAVTARIRYAIRRISATDPALGRHLTLAVHTGTFCVYDPEPRREWKT
ncbi:AAA family ATPase [Amycolatopsis acidicola]|uniref:AAA family ATPase n=1 Tax=Amycolatopsis acidicola TaxID=2596893 RepID=A0A5N0UXS6_9PSEU|nr:AAA family ATPase [Amycolatopsis acidicola]KAA9156015.1 AAA family ATPase [Amycolatopsis acidicola]